MKRFNAFGAHNFCGKLDDLVSQLNDFKKDEISVFRANSLAIACWNLEEWAFKDPLLSNTIDRDLFRRDLFRKCPALAIMHDIANSEKHKGVSRPKATIKDNGTKLAIGDYHPGDYNREDYRTTRFEIELENNTVLEFYNEAKKVVEFWQDFFKSHSG